MPIPRCASDLPLFPLDAAGTAFDEDSALLDWPLCPSPDAAAMCTFDYDAAFLGSFDSDAPARTPAPTEALQPLATQAALAPPKTQKSLHSRSSSPALGVQQYDPKERSRLTQRTYRRRKKDHLQALAKENQQLKAQLVEGLSEREQTLHAVNRSLQADLLALRQRLMVAETEIFHFENLFREYSLTSAAEAEVSVDCWPSRPAATMDLRCRTSRDL
jgi:hypothetical protein